VENERAHQEDFSFFGEAGGFSVAGDLPGNRGGLNDSGKMGPWGDSKRAVCGLTVVEMEPDGEKLAKHGLWGAGVVDTLLEGGEIEIFRSDLSRERKHQILMLRYFPIGGCGFVESNGLDGDCICGEVAAGDEFAFESEGGFPDGGVVEEAAFAGAVILEQRVTESVEDVL
jgi:hypothetical protein